VRHPTDPSAARSLVFLLVLPALAGCLGSTSPTPDGALEPSAVQGEVREFHVNVDQATEYSPHEGKHILGFGFGFSPEGPFTIPGPEIRVKQGDTVRAWLHSTGLGHTIHWHGLKLPWAMDGVPFMTQEVVMGNSTYLYEFVANETGTYWYHCHVEAPSHVDAGLFGALIVEPRDPAQDPPFDREHTLLLHEWDSTNFALIGAVFGSPQESGNLGPNPFDAAEETQSSARSAYDVMASSVIGGPAGDAAGGEGPRDYYPLPSIRYRPQYDTFMINGKSFPETEPLLISSGETVRIRLINAGQLVHAMHLHGTHFLVTHKDGYNLPAPYYADTLLIGPAERYDVYVEGDNPGIWDFHDHGGAWNLGGYASNDYAFPGGMATMLVYEDFEYAQLPKPEPEGGWRAGDYMAFAPSHKGHAPPDRLHRTGGGDTAPGGFVPPPSLRADPAPNAPAPARTHDPHAHHRGLAPAPASAPAPGVDVGGLVEGLVPRLAYDLLSWVGVR
jgi:manganese oxidase